MPLKCQNTMNKITSFINTLHTLWLTDSMEMEEFMQVAWALMLYHNISWKQTLACDVDEFIAFIEKNDMRMNWTTEESFEYEINDKSKDRFENFEAVCMRHMDFSKLSSSSQNKAA